LEVGVRRFDVRDELRTVISLSLSRDGFRQILRGSFCQAEALFIRALSLDNDNAYARLGLAEVTACQEELAVALPKYREAVERARPEDRTQFIEAFGAALIRAAVKARDAGENGQAERYFRQALLLTTNDTLRLACHEALAGLCADAGKNEAAAWHYSQLPDR
jgi:Tfp pilus assembly protein PilF